MSRLSIQVFAVLAFVTMLVLVCLQSFGAKPALSEVSTAPAANEPMIVATAAAPPTLTAAKLGGKPVHVLYMTRTGDTVLVRCYPGFEPTISVRAMGGASGTKEGVLICKSPS